jgi:tetratricopeptide (TPR) repeat protein
MKKGKFKLIQIIAVVFLMLSSSLFSQIREESQLIGAYKSEKNENRKFSRLLSIGDYYKQNNIHKADSLKNVILEKSKTLNESYRFKALLYSAEIAEIEGNQIEYFKDIIALQPFLDKSTSEEIQFEVYRHMGFYYSSLLQFEKAKLYLNLALALSKKSRNNADIAETYSSIAYNFMLANQKDSSFYFTNEAIQYARRSANKSSLAESFNTQSRIYSYFGQIELSVAKNYISLQLASGVNDLPKMARYTREIGESQLLISNYIEAEKYFNQSIDYSEQIHDERQVALALSNIGTVYKARKNYQKAIEYNEKAIKILTVLNDYNGLGEAHNNLGVIYREQHKYDKAAHDFNEALVYYESTNNREKIAGVYHNVGTVFKQKKKYKIALNYLERSIEIRKHFGSKSQIFYTYRVMADVYKEIGKTNESLNYLHLYLDFLDSNTSIQESAKIAELSELYRSEQRERLISMQADSIERQRQEKFWTSTKLENTELKNSQKTYIIIGFIIIILLAGVIGFYRLNQRTIMQQQKDAEMLQTLLRTQMNPHFIFNSMSVIQSYIYDNDIKNSSKFLVNFSRLIRLILENSPKEFIPIATEVEILQKYLETQKLRFEERFEFSVEIDDQMMLENAMIPPMITQPFIENAIEHGQLHTIEGGFIRVVFSKNNEMLEIKIEDNGIGRKNSEKNKKSKDHTSMALNITKERINNLNNKYKTSGYLIMEDYDKVLETGTKVLISLPYQVDAQTKNK